MKFSGKIFRFALAVILLLALWWLLSLRNLPDKITYGVSFSKLHSDELKLNWQKVYLAILDELKVRNLRLSAHWPMVEPEKDKFNFSETDFQMNEARKRNAQVILAIGRRLPGWPECHIPDWAKNLPEDKQREEILALIKVLVLRYRDYSNLKYWQVENEPFLGFFASQNCPKPDEDFLRQEIELVRNLDPSHPVLITDSGEFGSWFKAYRNGDIFGSSMYLYVWSSWLGPIRYPIGPSFFKVKQNLIELFYGKKEKILIELAAEPWLTTPIVEAPIKLQLERMGIEKFNEVIDFAQKSGFASQYLWGAEWWYWMKNNGHPEFWNEAKKLLQ